MRTLRNVLLVSILASAAYFIPSASAMDICDARLNRCLYNCFGDSACEDGCYTDYDCCRGFC